jgi:UTP--glucose-1-phosphate uridylyltransferase
MKIRKAVVPAAGRGTRLYPATRAQPKEMLPLGRKPTIQLVVEELVGAGLDTILIVTGADKRAIEDHFDRASGEGQARFDSPVLDDSRWRVFCTRQSAPRGLGDAVAHAQGFADGEPFVVALGDAVIESPRRETPLQRLMRVHEDSGAQVTILLRTVPPEAVSQYGIVRVAGEAEGEVEIQDIVEKPALQEAPSRLAVSGRYCLDPVVFDYLRVTKPGVGGEVQLTDAIRAMLRDGLRARGVCLETDERRHDIGTFRDYLRAVVEVSLGDPQVGPGLREDIESLLRGW